MKGMARKGLAAAVGAAFVKLCLDCGVEPAWDCFDYNEPSVRLAARLGFVNKYDYLFYSFNRPIDAA